MTVEVLTPLKIRFGGEIRALVPGQPVELPDKPAKKLLEKAGSSKVRVVVPAVTVGQMVMWDSPLFGVVQAVALAVTDKSVTVFHPLTEQEATIPLAWIQEAH